MHELMLESKNMQISKKDMEIIRKGLITNQYRSTCNGTESFCDGCGYPRRRWGEGHKRSCPRGKAIRAVYKALGLRISWKNPDNM